MNKSKYINGEWNKILDMRDASPYLFRTRIERIINHSINYASEINNTKLKNICELIRYKLNYISDQSNQTSDGMLNSYRVLHDNMIEILQQLN